MNRQPRLFRLNFTLAIVSLFNLILNFNQVHCITHDVFSNNFHPFPSEI